MNITDVFGDLPMLITDRLRLRRLTQADLQDIFTYTSDPIVAQYIRRPLHRSLADAEEYLNTLLDAYQQGEVAPWGIEHQHDQKIIGTCGFLYWSIEHARGTLLCARTKLLGARIHDRSSGSRAWIRIWCYAPQSY